MSAFTEVTQALDELAVRMMRRGLTAPRYTNMVTLLVRDEGRWAIVLNWAGADDEAKSDAVVGDSLVSVMPLAEACIDAIQVPAPRATWEDICVSPDDLQRAAS